MSELRKGEGANGWFKLLTQGEGEYYSETRVFRHYIIIMFDNEGEYYNVPVIEKEDNVTAHIRKLKVWKLYPGLQFT